MGSRFTVCAVKGSGVEGTGGKCHDTRNRPTALFIIGNHSAADAKGARRGVKRIRVSLPPVPEGIGCHGRARLFLHQPPKRVSGHVNGVRPNDIGAMLTESHLLEQLRYVP